MAHRGPRRTGTTTAERYCTTDAASTWTHGGHVVIDLTYTCEDGGEWDDEDGLGEGKPTSIIPTRAELAAGDLRLLYLAWLHAVSCDQVDPDDVESPVPASWAISPRRRAPWPTCCTSSRAPSPP